MSPTVSAYSYARESDGCDETFAIIALATRNVVASIHFWDDADKSEVQARRLVDALNAIHDIKPNFHVAALLEEFVPGDAPTAEEGARP